MGDIGLAVPESGFAHSVDEAVVIAQRIGFPIIIRPSFILGGAGTGIAHDLEQLVRLAAEGIQASPVSEILVERSIAGWKEYELEVMRDHLDNCVVVCSIENFDPMGVHTGDSITVAPAQTLSDVEYQSMRDDAFAVLRRVGVETGGSNVQFAVNPANGDRLVIEMNPRVSRSSALASKATGFPIAKIAARLAVGYALDEIVNDITKATPASFEPTIDYVVTKIPRWAFEKLPGASAELGTRMQSVGEVMAIGRNFAESLQKALRSLEQGRAGFGGDHENEFTTLDDDELWRRCEVATPNGSLRCTPSSLAGRARPRWRAEPVSIRGSSTNWRHSSRPKPGCGGARSTHSIGVSGDERSNRGSATNRSPLSRVPRRGRCVGCANRVACARSIRPSTPAPRSSRRRLRITTAVTTTRPRWRSRHAIGSSSSVRDPIALARGLNSIIAASTRPSPCARWATSPS